jgi:GNAT superfamily N-acetyltransferase
MTRIPGPAGVPQGAKIALRYRLVRRCRTEDVVRLYQAGGWWQESRAWRALIPDMVRGSFCFMVAETKEGEVVGMGRAISDGVSDAYIQDVVVLKEWRGRGIGAEIIRRLTRCLKKKKIGWVGLVAEPGTRHFYERLGYGQLTGFEPMLFGKER